MTEVYQDPVYLTSARTLKTTFQQHHQGHHPIWLFLFPKHRMLPDFLLRRLVQSLLKYLPQLRQA